jgi:hypothetical protein
MCHGCASAKQGTTANTKILSIGLVPWHLNGQRLKVRPIQNGVAVDHEWPVWGIRISPQQHARYPIAIGNCLVPIADSHDLEDRSFVAVIQDAKAVTQITVSFSLTWPALGQRKPKAMKDRLLEAK